MTEENAKPAALDELFPANEEMAWTALIHCSECGEVGRMHSTGEPRELTVWTCRECEEETVHETVMKTPHGEVVDQ